MYVNGMLFCFNGPFVSRFHEISIVMGVPKMDGL